MSDPYRVPADPGKASSVSIEDGLRDVLYALYPFDADQTRRILAAAAALYGLHGDDEEDESE